MAEIASPASDPRFLRRHYPHQVQGVVQPDLSAIAAPPLCSIENKAHVWEVNGEPDCAHSSATAYKLRMYYVSAVESFRNAGSRQAAIGLLLPLRWCERWPSIFHSPVSTPCRHYKHQTYPCRRKCLRASPCTSRRRHLFHRRTCHSQ